MLVGFLYSQLYATEPRFNTSKDSLREYKNFRFAPKVDAFFSNLTLVFAMQFRYQFMSFESLDFLTMWLAFIYGAVLFFVLVLQEIIL